MALAWQAEQELLCPGCGHPLDETTDPHLMRLWEATSKQCHACETKRLRVAAVESELQATPGAASTFRYGVHRLDPSEPL